MQTLLLSVSCVMCRTIHVVPAVRLNVVRVSMTRESYRSVFQFSGGFAVLYGVLVFFSFFFVFSLYR